MIFLLSSVSAKLSIDTIVFTFKCRIAYERWQTRRAVSVGVRPVTLTICCCRCILWYLLLMTLDVLPLLMILPMLFPFLDRLSFSWRCGNVTYFRRLTPPLALPSFATCVMRTSWAVRCLRALLALMLSSRLRFPLYGTEPTLIVLLSPTPFICVVPRHDCYGIMKPGVVRCYCWSAVSADVDPAPRLALPTVNCSTLLALFVCSCCTLHSVKRCQRLFGVKHQRLRCRSVLLLFGAAFVPWLRCTDRLTFVVSDSVTSIAVLNLILVTRWNACWCCRFPVHYLRSLFYVEPRCTVTLLPLFDLRALHCCGGVVGACWCVLVRHSLICTGVFVAGTLPRDC